MLTQRVVAKSKPLWRLVSKTIDRTPIAPGSNASHSPGIVKAQLSNLDFANTCRPVARRLNGNTASSSQVWHSDVNPTNSTGRPVAETTKKPNGTKLSHHNFLISMNNVGHLERVYSRTYDRN